MRYLALLLALFIQAGVQSISIPIQNSSFEDAVTFTGQFVPFPCGPYYSTGVPGWKVTGPWTSASGLGILQPTCIVPPDGKQVLVLQNVTISQDLGDAPGTNGAYGLKNSDGIYTLTFYVRSVGYPGEYHASLFVIANPPQEPLFTEPLCSISGWTNWDFTKKITLMCQSQRMFGRLSLSLQDEYEPIFLDDYALTFTPTN